MAEPTQLAFRTLKGIGVINAAPVYEPLPGFVRPEGNLRCCCYSPDGRFFAWASYEGVTVIDASAGHVVTTIPADNVFELGFSPLGTYIITWQRPSKDADGNAVKNLKVWRTIDDDASEAGARSVVGQFVQRSQTGWNLQYTTDEKYCARVVTNEVQFYESGDLRTVWNKLHLEGVTDFALSPGKNNSLAVFVPERKGQPAAVKVYNVPSFQAPISQKTFFKGDKVELKWNDLGTSLIVLAQTEVDKSNKSYYGETNMYLLSANGGFDSRIQLDKEGPIHSVAWNPNSKEFGVVYGYMPAKTVIFNTKAQPTHTFPLGPRNFVLFSPHGRFVLVAGFGNLAGQMDIYDLEKDFLKICTIEASNASVCEWSPDGKFILTATTSPRLRVDNGIRLWHVGGAIVYNDDMNELYHVAWRPQPPHLHPLENPFHPLPIPHASVADYLGRHKTPSKPVGAYRPPGARGTSTPLAFKREDEGGAAFVASNGISNAPTGPASMNGFGKSRRFVPGAEAADPLPPGAAPGGGVSLTGSGDGEELSKAAMKNKKKREAKKAKEAAQRDRGLSVGDVDRDTPRKGRSNSRSHADKLDRSGSRGDKDDRKARNENRSRSRGKDDGRQRSRSRQYKENGFSMADARPKTGYAAEAVPPLPKGKLNGQLPHVPPVQVPVAPPPEINVLSPTTPGSGATPQEKKMRSLLKKLRAIEELKMRQAAGEKLENTQVSKIDTESQVRKELEGIGYM